MFNFWKTRKQQDVPRCVLFGADTSGKTTLLYMWHLGDVVTTIPTIGFNVETILHNGRSLQVLDFGGCDMLAPMGRHYLDSSTGILFLHNLSSNPEWTQESIRLLKMHTGQLEETHGKYVWVMLTKQDLVLAEDLDRRRAEVYAMIKNELREYEPNIVWKVFDERGLYARDNAKTWPIFDEIAEVLNKQGVISKFVSATKQVSEADLLKRIEQEAAGEEPAEKFWQGFLTADLPHWNHRLHLRAGFIMLLRSAAVLEDFWTAIDTFLAHIERLRASRPDRFRNTAHRTMTMFWLYMLRSALLNFKIINGRLPEEDEFQEILLQQPRLADTSFWENFYSRNVMFTPEAKQNWCLPDKRPLPANIQPQNHSQAMDSKPDLGGKVVTKSATIEGKEAKEQLALLSFAFLVVQQYFTTGGRRGKVIAAALSKLQSSTMRIRASDPSASVAPYSETQAYFWIQVVHATLLPFQNQVAEPSGAKDTNTTMEQRSFNSVTTFTFAQFTHIFRLEHAMWKLYYSPGLWNSVKARMAFINPDLQPLPNVFPRAAPSVIATRFLESGNVESDMEDSTNFNSNADEKADRLNGTHTPEQTALQLDNIIAAAEPYQNGVMTSEQRQNLGPIPGHAVWLLEIYNAYSQSINTITSSLDVPRFISRLVEQNQRLDNDTRTSMTKILFYARMVLATQSASAINVSADGKSSHANAITSPMQRGEVDINGFRAFLESREWLLWSDLPFKYYRAETWNSLDAWELFIEPDLMGLPGI